MANRPIGVRIAIAGSKLRWLGRFAAGLGLLITLLPAPRAQKPQPPADSLLNTPAPAFVRKDLSGQRVDLTKYRGKVVLLNFWASWCAPCQLEMPRFSAWQRQYGLAELRIVGISMDDEAAVARKVTRKLAVNYPNVMGDEQLGNLYGGILGLPVTYLIGRDGQVWARYQGEADLKAMEAKIKELLQSR